MSVYVPPTFKSAPEPFVDPLDPRNYPPGTVGIIAQEIARFTSFAHCMYAVMANLPPGSGEHTQCGSDICENMNMICRTHAEHGGDWLWVMGDDHYFPGQILLRQLALMYEHDLDILVPHCLKRNPGWEPVVYSHRDEDGWLHVAELPESGLVEVYAAGSAGMLIRSRVLEEIGSPWFTPGDERLSEDVLFCEKATAAGFKIHCAPELLLGHTALHVVWPAWHDGRWHIEHVHDQREVIPVRRLHEEFDVV